MSIASSPSLATSLTPKNQPVLYICIFLSSATALIQAFHMTFLLRVSLRPVSHFVIIIIMVIIYSHTPNRCAHPTIYPLSIHPVIHHPVIHPSPTHSPTHLTIHPSIPPYTQLFTCPFVHPRLHTLNHTARPIMGGVRVQFRVSDEKMEAEFREDMKALQQS